MKRFAISALCSLLCVAAAVSAQSQPNLDAARRGLQTDYGKRVWADQMQGDAPKIRQDHIPNVATALIAQQLLKSVGADVTDYPHIQLVRLSTTNVPDQPNRYLLLAKATDFQSECASGNVHPPHLFLFDWVDDHAQMRDELKPSSLLCGSQIEILYAPVQLGINQWGFSLLTTATNGYAGGGASRSVLSLIEMAGNTLVPRLSTTHGEFSMIAGDWHRDGTREHDVSEMSCAVFANKKQVRDGYYTFIKKCQTSDNGSHARVLSPMVFRYDAQVQAYRTKSPVAHSSYFDWDSQDGSFDMID